MRTTGKMPSLLAVLALLRGAAPGPALAADTVTALAPVTLAGALTITVPTTAALGSNGAGGKISFMMGTVSVSDSRTGSADWTATVTASNFTSGLNSVSKGALSYWSGSATVQTGGGTRTPGQLTAANAQALSAPVIAFTGRKPGVGNQVTSWRPTVVVSIPTGTAPGVYAGTITHSAA